MDNNFFVIFECCNCTMNNRVGGVNCCFGYSAAGLAHAKGWMCWKHIRPLFFAYVEVLFIGASG